MNYSTAVFLINEKVRAIAVTYENDKTATVFKTLDETIRKDDFVVVPTDTRHGLTVCKVLECDTDVDFDSTALMRWIVAKVDRSDYDRTVKEEDAAIQAVKSAEIRKKREDLAAAMFKDNRAKFKELEIYDVAEDDKPAT